MPLSNLDEVPWSQLTHAYGTAEDVPKLLRQLETEATDATYEDSALYHLYGNIWHQGTVYEATSYAVPFLLELARDVALPKRQGVVGLLGAIANGSSYLDVHEDFMADIGVDGVGSAEHLETKEKELQWVTNARTEVAKGIDLFLELTYERSAMKLTAAETLFYLSDFDDRIEKRTREMLAEATDPIEEVCFLTMLSNSKTVDPGGAMFVDRLSHESRIVRRVATAICLSKKLCLDSILFREQMMEAVLAADHEILAEEFPFDSNPLHYLPNHCLDEFTAEEKKEAIEHLHRRLKALEINSEQVELLLDLAFPEEEDENFRSLTTKELTENQRQVLGSLLVAFKSDPEELRSLDLGNWGLPEYRRDLKNLIEGKPPNKIDKTLPLLGTEHDPRLTVQLINLKPGSRVHHRYFGFGTIKAYDEIEGDWEIEFDEEGTHFFSFRQKDLSPESWWSRFLGRYTFKNQW